MKVEKGRSRDIIWWIFRDSS